MAILLKINSTDRTDQVEWESLRKEEILTKEPDTLSFRLKNYGTKTYRPAMNDEVILYDVDGTTKIFGGIVIEVSEEVIARVQYFTVKCKDYTHTLDRKLVSKIYDAMTGNAIIADIITNYIEAGFTGTNVVCPDTVQHIVFNYTSVSQALNKLCEMLGDYDWYVDYNKDIHFFKLGSIPSAFNITDTSGNYFWNSLRIGAHIHQLRNKIIIRGGDVLGSLFTDFKIADGKQATFFVGYNLGTIQAWKALSATPTTFVSQTIGMDGKDLPASFNTLYNPDNGMLVFSTVPAVGDVVKWSGYPIYPLITEKTDLASVASYGEYQYVIVDKTILSKASASQRADAELKKNSSQYNEGTFQTIVGGLRSGQTINVNSAIRGISKDYKIQRITTTLQTPTSFLYDVQLLASEEVTMVDVLNKLIVKDVSNQIEIGLNEIVDRLYSMYEPVTLTESVTISQSHNATPETITMTEVVTPQALNYPTNFVVGNFSNATPEYFGELGTSLKGQYLLNETSGVSVIDRTNLCGNGTLKIKATAYYPFDGNALDGSTSGANGTVVGATLTTDRFGNSNSAYAFTKGSNNSITMSGTADVTAKKWFVSCIASISMQSVDATHLWRFQGASNLDCMRLTIEPTTGYPFVWKVNSGGVGSLGVKPSVNVADGLPHTISVTYNNATGICIMVIDGVSYTGTDTALARASTIFLLGDDSVSLKSITGSIDEVLVSSTTGATPTVIDMQKLYTLLLSHKLNKPYISGVYNGMYDLWGSSDSAGSSVGSYIEFTTGFNSFVNGIGTPFTLSFLTSVSSQASSALDRQLGWYGGNYKGSMCGVAYNGNVSFQVGRGNTTGVNSNYNYTASGVYTPGTVARITMCYDGTNLTGYVNSTLVHTANLGAMVDNGTGQSLICNRNPWDFYRFSSAKYDDIRLYNVGLTATQVAELVTTSKRQFCLDSSPLA